MAELKARRVLLTAPDFHCATGATPRLLAELSIEYRPILFRTRDISRRRDEFRALASTCDVVHWHTNLVNFPDASAEAALLRGRVTQIATVHHVENGEDEKVVRACELADVISVPSAATAVSLDPALLTRPVVVAPYVVDWRGVDRVLTKGNTTHCPELRIGWSGRASAPGDRKHVDHLVDAVALLRRDGESRHSNARLVLQGVIPASIISRAERVGVPTSVVPWGAWRQRELFFKSIDVYASVSSVEGGPLPVFEAAVRGLPVLCTPVGLGADLIVAGGAVELPTDDPRGQAEAIAALCTDEGRLATLTAICARAAREITGPPAVRAHEELWSSAASVVRGRVQPAPSSRDVGAIAPVTHNLGEIARDQAAEAVELINGRRTQAGLRLLLTPSVLKRLPASARRGVATASVRALASRVRSAVRA